MSSKTNNQEISDQDLAPVYKLFSRGNYKEALSLLDNLTQNFPNNDLLYTLGGNCYSNLKEYELAISCYEEAIKINPNSADSFNNKANALENLRKFDEAIFCAKKAIQIKPDFALAFFNLGVNAMHLRLFDLSMESFDMAIQLQPNFEKYKFAKSTLLLLFGDFKNGWSLWESRWKLDKLFSPKLEANCPVWTGDKNSKLLVWAEQGVGDQIMYSGLIPDLSKICSDLIVQVEPRLISLFDRSLGDKCTFYPNNKSLSVKYDKHIAMGSLCQYLRNDEKDFESSRYGFLKDDEIKTANIKKDLLALTPSNNKICGISWRSVSPKTGIHKTIPLKFFIETLALEGYTFVSLQYGDTADEIKEVKDELGIDIVSYEKVDNFNDIDGLASLIQACDTVISIDNVTCQLAGALGKEIHVLLTYGSWWGWMANRSDSPWYSSVKLYRQEKINTWGDVLEKVRGDL